MLTVVGRGRNYEGGIANPGFGEPGDGIEDWNVSAGFGEYTLCPLDVGIGYGDQAAMTGFTFKLDCVQKMNCSHAAKPCNRESELLRLILRILVHEFSGIYDYLAASAGLRSACTSGKFRLALVTMRAGISRRRGGDWPASFIAS